MWYGQCGMNPSTNKPINCLYNGPAKPVDGPKSREILFELCPEFAHNDSKVCCSHSQLVSLQSGIQSAQQMMARCPGCWKNFRELYCRMTCSPNNSMFINAKELSANKTAITAIDYYVDKAFRDGLYNSCKNVVFPSSGQKIMSFMCGTSADKCTPLKFLNFMGNPVRNGESPFSIDYPTTHDDSIDPMYVKIKLCNETVFRPVTNKTSKPCSCQDCIESCPPLPHYTPTKHWELDIGDIHFNIISFATLLVYLAFLVLFIAGSILYYKFSSKPSYQTHQYPQAVIGSRQRSLGVLARLGNSMDRTIKNIFTRWGNICCDYSIVVIIGAVVFIIICSVGLLKFTVVTDPVKLWSSPGSQARREKDTFDNKFSPFYRTAQIIFSVKPGSKWNSKSCSYKPYFAKHCKLTGKILHFEVLQKVLKVQTHLIHMTADYGSEKITLQDICKKPMAPYNNNCTVMSALQYWQNDAKKLNKCITAFGKPCNSPTYKFPSAAWGDHLYACADNPTSTNDSTALGLPCTSLFGGPVSPSIAFGGYEGNNYTDAKVLVVTFVINNHNDDSKNDKAKAWEKEFLNYMKNFKDPDLDVAFRAERSIEDEIERESHADIYTIIVSYLIMFLYITFALGQINQCDRFMIDSKFSLAFGGIMIVLGSVLCSLGIFSFANKPATLIIIEVVPFLVLAVGVDNIFILVQKYQRDLQQPGETVSNQIGRVLGEVAPSMLLTSTSEAVAFAFGALSSMPAVKVFSLYASVAVFVNFLLQVTCFVALMSLDVRRQQGERFDVICCYKNSKVPKRKNTPSLLYQFFDKILSPALLSEFVRPAVVILFTTLLALSIMFIPSIEIGLDQSLSMPKDSYMITYFKMQQETLKVGAPVYFVVDNPKYPYQLRQWQNKVCGGSGCDNDSLIQIAYEAFRRSEQTKIGMSLSSWLDDYFSWADPSGKYPCCRLLDYSNKTGHKVIPKPGTFCNASMTESYYHCHSCLLNNQIGQRPNTTQFRKYLPYFLKDNPEINCTKG
ncbi:Niemann-Pick C1 [Paramuricea clavata]|nr:Niemann-Pick C1 [Paramuricea clavata]